MKKIDHESLATFAEESALRLARIADKLELLAGTGPVDMELLHGIFRDTHSLKSAANLLTLGTVEQIAHKLEDILESLRSGQDLPDEQLIDILSAGYTRIEQLLKNTHVLPLIDPDKEIAAIDARLLARRSTGRR
ncbi:MAG: Hpt domain-containing protein [Desulfuromonadaceae bacterium]|nr:Hpt domain-containing protein [Desulfuromonadaceae bacterium]MDD5105269.1 Hpt domain-containing protein [Desulfuromonadaceae bacterium]